MAKFIEQIAEPSRPELRVGDLYAYKMAGRYYFARIIAIDLPLFPGSKKGQGPNLVYYYLPSSESLSKVPPLDCRDLLIPPRLTVSEEWLDGDCVLVERRPLRQEERLPVHCFIKWDGSYVDEQYRPLPARLEPCQEISVRFGLPEDELAIAMGLVRDWGEYMSLPNLPRIERPPFPRPPSGATTVELRIPHEEMTALGLGMAWLHEQLYLLVKKKRLGKWVETGACESYGYHFYEVKPAKLRQFVEAVMLFCQAANIRNYMLIDEDTEEDLTLTEIAKE